MNRTDLPLPNPMMLPFGLQQILENELDKGETLLWLDQPDGSRMARSSLPTYLKPEKRLTSLQYPKARDSRE